MVAVAVSEAAPAIVDAAWLIPAFPLVGALVLLAFGRRIGRASGPLATVMLFASFVVTGITYLQVSALGHEERSFTRRLYEWIGAGDFAVTLDYRIDPLSIVMMLVVTGVGALIHLYSVGYMRGDEREPRFFAYLNLFVFSMLTLVLANNFLVLYVGWELVGLCSYLLIGFWFDRPAAASAAKKAFVVNRVGDFAFAIGILWIFNEFGTLDFDTVFASAPVALATGTATAISLLLFAGATGKSAQIPLYVWLPDAMEGPTPVSALIHAATMVTAGVYMVARTHVLFDLSPVAGDVVAAVGVATAILAGLIAIAQDDIKRVLAYSTVSQLGFMFVAVGVGAYTAGIYHLVTHAFFKALLFLGAGSVMHAMANRTDIRTFGGLMRAIPWTGATFAIGWLAIIGFPGTSGFFSKDQILEGAYHSGNYVVWGAALFGVVLTGFYMTRLFVLTFLGRSRDDSGHHPHESPPSMVFPLVFLAVASAGAGFFLGMGAEEGRLYHFLEPVVHVEGAHGAGSGLSVLQLTGIALAAALAGVLGALFAYRGDGWLRRREAPALAWRSANAGFGIDQAYGLVFTGAGKVGASALAFVVDARWIDGVVNGVGLVTARIASAGRKLQTGMVRTYALGVLGGTVLVLALLLGRTLR